MKNLTLIFLVISCLATNANEPFGASKQPFGKPKAYFELMGGGVVPSMVYSNAAINSLEKEFPIKLTGGVATRVQYSRLFSNSLQISYMQQGVKIPSIDYQLKTNYMNAFLPFEIQVNAFGCKKRNCTTMLAFAGPYAALGLNGEEQLGEKTTKLRKTDFGTFDFGAEAGIGLRIPTYSTEGTSNLVLKISYFRGFNNTYPETTQGINNIQFVEGGTRFNHGIKATIGIELPLYSKSNVTFTGGGDGKRTYKRFVIK